MNLQEKRISHFKQEIANLTNKHYDKIKNVFDLMEKLQTLNPYQKIDLSNDEWIHIYLETCFLRKFFCMVIFILFFSVTRLAERHHWEYNTYKAIVDIKKNIMPMIERYYAVISEKEEKDYPCVVDDNHQCCSHL